jgi:hypothetical protein
MTQQRDIERLLDHWFEGGPSEAPDRVVDVVADRIGRQTQLPAWRVHRRVNDMYRTIGAVAGIAAVLVIAFIGFNAFGGQRSPAAAGSSAGTAPTPVASVTPSDAPAASATLTAQRSGLTWSVTGTLPDGWHQDDPFSFVSDHASVEILTDRSVMAANCDLRPEAGVGRSAAEIVGALAARDGLIATGQQVTAVGGLSGQQIDIVIDPMWTGTCPEWEGKPVVPLVGTLDEKNLWLYNAALAGEQYRYIVLDVPRGGNVLISILASEPEQLADHLPAAMSVVEALEFSAPQ